MKKLLMGVCAISLFINLSVGDAQAKDYAGQSAAATSKVIQRNQAMEDAAQDTPTPVEKTADGANYDTKAGDQAAMADTALNAVSLGLAAWSLAQRLDLGAQGTADEAKRSQGLSLTTDVLTFSPAEWFPIFVTIDWVGTAIQLGHAAVNKFMRDETFITASFSGEQGYTTDKWVGPPAMNKTTEILDKTAVTSHKFGALGFDAKNYPGLKDAQHASAAELMQYRSNQILEDQRSLKNVTESNWGLLYRAQQRSIKGLASALELKKQLSDLAAVESLITADYQTKPKALNSVASRRALHDALLLLKMNVMAARTRLRSETLELDFKPKTKETEEEEDDSPTHISRNN